MTTILFYFACYCCAVSTVMLIMSICFMPIFLVVDKRNNYRLRIRLHWIWFDFWMGMFYDKKKKVIWFSPFPMMLFRIWMEEKF